MRKSILIAKTFGIGNAIMAVPMIKAIRAANPQARVDVLVGNTPDDVGALEILSSPLVLGQQGKVYVDVAREIEYDTAVLSIPYDGRWRAGHHFLASEVLDGRTRPDPRTTGLVSWRKHEVEYQMENARALGYDGPIPDCSFDEWDGRKYVPHEEQEFYIGVGYKKDSAGFWKVKHWGNDNYAQLITLLLKEFPRAKIISTGDALDHALSLFPITKKAKGLDGRFCTVSGGSLYDSFRIVGRSSMYVGNDTGMMHVAAAYGKKVLGLFFMENSVTKSRPWCPEGEYMDGSRDRSLVTPEAVLAKIKEMKR